MAAITLLAFASMAASLFIADTTQGLATAINESGALRMRAYRIASYLTQDNVNDREHWEEIHKLIQEFEQHIHNSNLTNVLQADQHHLFHKAYQKILNQWQQEIRPLFEIYMDGIIDTGSNDNDMIDMSISSAAVINLRNQYFMIVSDFVKNIDKLVSLLEQDTETKIRHLHNFQFFSLLLTTLLTITALIIVYRRIHKPLKQLLTGAEQASRGDFSFHVACTGKDEIGRLGQAFNTMAEDLSKIYNELEDRVKQKTTDLEKSNCSLELLYKTVKRLNEAESPHTVYNDILKDIEKYSGTGRGAICLKNDKTDNAAMIASTWITNRLTQHLCKKSNCQKCLNTEKNQLIKLDDGSNNQKNIYTFPIINRSQHYGVLIIEPSNNTEINQWQRQLLEAIARHIGIAINISQQSAEKRRMALIEERGAIARELHDSLAQSLTFMKIQVSRLESIIEKTAADSEASSIVSELRIGLNSAYKELRELLTTFRLKIDGHDFNNALAKTILEFNDRSSTEIIFDNDINYWELTPNEEIHMLQLVRESLSNIIKHANASHAHIRIKYKNNGDIQMTIRDNGIGINLHDSKTHHYGLSIMKERAQSLNGTLSISKHADGGTIIKLFFTPTNKLLPVELRNSHSNF